MVEFTGQLHSRNLRKQQTKFDPQHVLILDLYWCWFDRDTQKVSALTRGLKPHFMANSPVLKNENTTAATVLRVVFLFFFLYWTVFPLCCQFLNFFFGLFWLTVAGRWRWCGCGGGGHTWAALVHHTSPAYKIIELVPDWVVVVGV